MFGGVQGVYRHQSRETGTPMTFSVYLPPQAATAERLPVVWYLSGLTCTHANVTDKGQFQRLCAEVGLVERCELHWRLWRDAEPGELLGADRWG